MALSRISLCIAELSAWMANYLKLNSAKTEFIAFDRSAASSQYPTNIQLVIGDQDYSLACLWTLHDLNSWGCAWFIDIPAVQLFQ